MSLKTGVGFITVQIACVYFSGDFCFIWQ